LTVDGITDRELAYRGIMKPHVGVERRWNRLSEALRLREHRRKADRERSGGPEIPHVPSWDCRPGATRVWLVAQLTSAVLEISQAGFTGARHPQPEAELENGHDIVEAVSEWSEHTQKAFVAAQRARRFAVER
jgi:hypothetical protein